MYTRLKILLAFFSFLGIMACNKKNTDSMTQDHFSYAVTVNAPEGYPIEVHEGGLMDKDLTFICAMPKAGKQGDGWIYDGVKAGQGGSSIPYHLVLTYVAYAEKKFYTVDAALPADKILQEFRKGFRVEGDPDENKIRHIEHETYDTFTIGAAPGGVIVVWLSAGHHRVEICRLQAKETFVDVNDFYRNPDGENQQQFFDSLFKIAVPEATQEEIAKKGIPYGLWDQYRERYTYRFVLKPYDRQDKFTFESIHYFNGEGNLFYEEDLEKKEYLHAAIPYKANLSFTIYNTTVFFDDQEMMKVFGDFKKSHPDLPMDIIIQPDFAYEDVKISVRCGDQEVPLKKYRIEGIWTN